MEDIFKDQIGADLESQDYELQKETLLSLNQLPTDNEILPEDAMLNIIRFLDQTDVSNLACTCKSLRRVCNNPIIWKELDLRAYWHKADDSFVEHLLTTSDRYTMIESLRFDMCRALSKKVLKLVRERCPNLRKLTMYRCTQIQPEAIISFIDQMPKLEFIEFYGCSLSSRMINNIICKNTNLDIGVNILIVL